MTLEEAEEAELQKRDAAVVEAVNASLKYKEDLARQMRADAKELETQAAQIRTAVRERKWWRLSELGVSVDDDVIESLCNIDPDLSGDIK